LAEDISETEILEAQQILAKAGFFVESASATAINAVKKLKNSGQIEHDDKVMLILTGSGSKDLNSFENTENSIRECSLENIKIEISKILNTRSFNRN